MADLETRVDKLDERVTSLERQVSNTMTKVDAIIDEMHDMRQEMRDRDNQRATDIREIRASVSTIQNRIDDMGKHVRNLAITSMAAIGAMVVTVIMSLLRN